MSNQVQMLKKQIMETEIMLEALRAENNVKSFSNLLENDLGQASLILAAQDVMSKLQDIAEDLSTMMTKDVMPISDNMKVEFGPSEAETFETAATEGIQNALNAVRQAKDQINEAIMIIEGDLPANDMASDEGEMDSDDGTILGDIGDEPVDDFGGSDAASGPADNPLGRDYRESIELPSLRVIGEKILMKESITSLVSWALLEASGRLSHEAMAAFADKLNTKVENDPESTAGWIATKKYSNAHLAQLSNPSVTSTAKIGEGKSWKKDMDDVENGCDSDKKKKMTARDTARMVKSKSNESMTLDETKAMLIGMIIEANIESTGKGNASQVMKNVIGDQLNEETGNSILEAFNRLYGMSPGIFSSKLMLEFQMTDREKKKFDASIGKMAGEIATNPSLRNTTVQSAMGKLDPADKQTLTRYLDPDERNDKVTDLIADKMKTNENINEPKWPTSPTGQYKGEPFQTDYGKFKANQNKATGKTDAKVSTMKSDSKEPLATTGDTKITDAKKPASGEAQEGSSGPKVDGGSNKEEKKKVVPTTKDTKNEMA